MSGLTPQEATVMAAWDGGLSTRGIARQTGISHDRVARIVTYFGENNSRTDRAMVIRGSAALLAALSRERAA